MKIIIDGYNLMYRMEVTGSLEQKREKVLEALAQFLSINPNEMLVVFDGRNNPSTQRGKEVKYGIKIFYSAQGETADDYIMEMISKRTGKARTYLIVSSDREITNFAVKNHMKIASSDEFVEYLDTD
jgi:predicted RNA-binding protein with PIN domain